MVEAVRGEALRPAEMQPDPGVRQHRQPFHHGLVERPEVIPVFGQAGELRVGGDAARGPGIAARLEEADHEPGALVPHVGKVRGGLDRRQAGRKARDRLGDDVVVRERLKRDADAGQRAELASPHAGGGHHVLGLDVPVLGGDAGDPPVAAGHPGHHGVLDDPHAVLAGARSQRHGGVGGVAPPVVRVVHRAGEVPGVQRREQLDRLLRGDRLGGDPAGARGRGLPQQFLQALSAVGQVQGPGPLEPGGEPGLLLQRVEDPQAPADDLPGAVGRPGLRDQASRVPGGAGGQPLALQHHHVGPASSGQVVRGTAANDAASDDDDPGPGRQGMFHSGSVRLPVLAGQSASGSFKRRTRSA